MAGVKERFLRFNKKFTLHPHIQGVVVAAAVGIFVLEQLFPLRQRKRKLLPRMLTNAVTALSGYPFQLYAVVPLEILAANQPSRHKGGLLIELVKFLLLDASQYLWHRMLHTNILWPIHRVHHADPDMDESTGYRFHFLDQVVTIPYRTLVSALLAPKHSTLILYNSIFLIATLFHHSNFNLGRREAYLLSYFIVTPHIHGLHHSRNPLHAFSNYGVIFTIWDRLAKTYTQPWEHEDIDIGLHDDAYSSYTFSELQSMPWKYPGFNKMI